MLALAAVLLAVGLSASGLAAGAIALTVGLGCIALFAAVGLLASRAVKPLARCRRPHTGRLYGAPGRLPRENSVRDPARTARTAGALMIGTALVTFAAVLGAGLKSTVRTSLQQQVSADVLASKSGFEPLAASAGAAASRAPGVALASSIRTENARAHGSDVDITGVDPATIGGVYAYRCACRMPGWGEGRRCHLRAPCRTAAVQMRQQQRVC